MYRYFQTVDALPDTSGPLSASLSPAAIKDVNEAVRSATRVTKPRGKYAKFTPEQQAAIGEYASLHGNQATIRRVSKQLGEAAHAKLKNAKFYSKGNLAFMRKFAPTKISRYTVPMASQTYHIVVSLVYAV